jgi:hypothetical protein
MIICMDLIVHTSLPTWFQNKFWYIIGIVYVEMQMEFTFQTFQWQHLNVL